MPCYSPRREVNMHISAQTKYTVEITEKERSFLHILIHKGQAKTRTITRARILLMADEGKKDTEIYQSLSTSYSTPHDIRKRYHEGGLNRALYDAPRPGQKRKLTGKQEAWVITIACTDAPKGYVRWTLDLLTEKIRETIGITIGRTAIWKVLLRNDTKPWLKKNVVYTQGYS